MSNASALILSETPLGALRALVALRRAVDSRFTLSYLSKRLGIKSRSYLSEVFREKKNLNPKHIHPLVEQLELAEAEAELLRGRLMLVYADLSPIEAEQWARAVRDRQKALTSSTVELSDVKDINLVMTLAVCLHLFEDGKASRREILDLFRADRRLEVDRGLSDLVQSGLLERENDQFRYSATYADKLHLYSSTTREKQIDYLRSSLREAEDQLKSFQPERGDMIFYSGLITAEQASYLQSLDHVRQNLRGIQSRIESHPADSLVRFSIQIYPVAKKSEGPL